MKRLKTFEEFLNESNNITDNMVNSIVKSIITLNPNLKSRKKDLLLYVKDWLKNDDNWKKSVYMTGKDRIESIYNVIIKDIEK